MIINKTRHFDRGHFLRVRLDWLGVLFIFRVGAIKKSTVSVSELERLEIIRRIREEHSKKKFSRTDIAIEEMTIRKW